MSQTKPDEMIDRIDEYLDDSLTKMVSDLNFKIIIGFIAMALVICVLIFCIIRKNEIKNEHRREMMINFRDKLDDVDKSVKRIDQESKNRNAQVNELSSITDELIKQHKYSTNEGYVMDNNTSTSSPKQQAEEIKRRVNRRRTTVQDEIDKNKSSTVEESDEFHLDDNIVKEKENETQDEAQDEAQDETQGEAQEAILVEETC